MQMCAVVPTLETLNFYETSVIGTMSALTCFLTFRLL
jgi:hypothetical protein